MLPPVNSKRKAMILISASIWIGLVLGVSFFAAPIKFSAEGVSRDDLLRVGQVTFQAFTWIEWFAWLGLVAAIGRHYTRALLAVAITMTLWLVIQKFWLLPILDGLLVQRLAGEAIGEHHWHTLYITSDIIKLILLGGLLMILHKSG